MNKPVSTAMRLGSIDAMRGLVILLMLVDHTREKFYLHHPLSDPMNLAETQPELFFTRLTSHLCAPVFVFLTGVAAFLYGEKHGDRRTLSAFLWKRGLFLVVLEITVINLSWTLALPPAIIYLQVIWVIGLSMIALSILIWLPWRALLAVALLLIFGHNLLTPIAFTPESLWFVPWAVLHDRSMIVLTDTLSVRTSYPLLPWIGIIAAGYAAGRLFTPAYGADRRQRILLVLGVAMLTLFVLLRGFDIYGETRPWVNGGALLAATMSFFNLTKYPPSLLFTLFTLGIALLVLRHFERAAPGRWLAWLACFGKVPLFFYVLHLYVLSLLYTLAVPVFGFNQGTRFGFDQVWSIWLGAAALALILYWPCRWFAAYKARHREKTWLSYL